MGQRMLIMIRSRPRLTVAMVAAVGVGAVGLQAATGSGPADPPLDVPGASASTLAAGGVVLNAAKGAVPACAGSRRTRRLLAGEVK